MKSAPATGSDGPAYARITTSGLVLLGTLAVLVAWPPAWLARIQTAGFDLYQRIKPRAVVSMPAVVVEIDERSLARLGQWPWPRTLLADLVRAVGQHDPAAIGVDILMPEPDRLSPERLLPAVRQSDPVLARRLEALPSNDAVLADALADGPIVLGLAGTQDDARAEPLAPPFVIVDAASGTHRSADQLAEIPHFTASLTNIATLDRAARGHGALSAGPANEPVRRIPLVVRIGDRLVPAFGVEMLRVALDVPEVTVRANGAEVDAISLGRFTAPTEADGHLRLYYSPRDSRRSVSAVDVLDGRIERGLLERKLVLIGATGLALVDYQATPLGVAMPGSEIHAQLLENLYEQSWLMRPWWARIFEVAMLVALGVGLILATPRWKPARATSLAFASIALPIVVGVALFVSARYVVDALLPSLGLALVFVALLVATLSEAARHRRALQRAIQQQREEAAFIAGELEAAKRIQIGFLPPSDALAGDPRIEIAASMTTARVVGGDLYDFFRLDAHRVFFLIGDVAGKGLSASLFMAVGKALCKSIALRTTPATVSELMRAANAEISRDNPEMFFVTAWAAILDLRTGLLSYCNAGHENPYRLTRRGELPTRINDSGGPPLCVVDDFDYAAGGCRLEPGEILCLVTDGVADATNPAGERCGAARVAEVLGSLDPRATTAQQCVDALCADVRAFVADAEPADDLTVLAVKWCGPERDAGR